LRLLRLFAANSSLYIYRTTDKINVGAVLHRDIGSIEYRGVKPLLRVANRGRARARAGRSL